MSDTIVKNVMEVLVEQNLDNVLNKTTCCNCTRCRNDIMAYTLNLLPPKYVATVSGEIYSRASSLSMNQSVEIVTAIAQAIKIVHDSPRH